MPGMVPPGMYGLPILMPGPMPMHPQAIYQAQQAAIAATEALARSRQSGMQPTWKRHQQTSSGHPAHAHAAAPQQSSPQSQHSSAQSQTSSPQSRKILRMQDPATGARVLIPQANPQHVSQSQGRPTARTQPAQPPVSPSKRLSIHDPVTGEAVNTTTARQGLRPANAHAAEKAKTNTGKPVAQPAPPVRKLSIRDPVTGARMRLQKDGTESPTSSDHSLASSQRSTAISIHDPSAGGPLPEKPASHLRPGAVIFQPKPPLPMPPALAPRSSQAPRAPVHLPNGTYGPQMPPLLTPPTRPPAPPPLPSMLANASRRPAMPPPARLHAAPLPIPPSRPPRPPQAPSRPPPGLASSSAFMPPPPPPSQRPDTQQPRSAPIALARSAVKQASVAAPPPGLRQQGRGAAPGSDDGLAAKRPPGLSATSVHAPVFVPAGLGMGTGVCYPFSMQPIGSSCSLMRFSAFLFNSVF